MSGFNLKKAVSLRKNVFYVYPFLMTYSFPSKPYYLLSYYFPDATNETLPANIFMTSSSTTTTITTTTAAAAAATTSTSTTTTITTTTTTNKNNNNNPDRYFAKYSITS